MYDSTYYLTCQIPSLYHTSALKEGFGEFQPLSGTVKIEGQHISFTAVIIPLEHHGKEHKPFVVSVTLERLIIYTDPNWYKIKMSSVSITISFLEFINKL